MRYWQSLGSVLFLLLFAVTGLADTVLPEINQYAVTEQDKDGKPSKTYQVIVYTNAKQFDPQDPKQIQQLLKQIKDYQKLLQKDANKTVPNSISINETLYGGDVTTLPIVIIYNGTHVPNPTPDPTPNPNPLEQGK